MQAITIAIGKAGVNYFAHHYLIDNLIGLLSKLTPPGKSIDNIASFEWGIAHRYKYSNISIRLDNGSLRGFTPGFQSLAQGVTSDAKKTPIFTLKFDARNFSAHYNWTENYHWDHWWGEMVDFELVQHHEDGD